MIRKKILFRAAVRWLVWLLLAPFVVVRYLWSDLVNLRRAPTAWLKAGLVRRAVYAKTVLGRT